MQWENRDTLYTVSIQTPNKHYKFWDERRGTDDGECEWIEILEWKYIWLWQKRKNRMENEEKSTTVKCLLYDHV